jgi:hypothetical protein
MKRVKISVAALGLLCAVMQGCGLPEDSGNGIGSEARGDAEIAATENHPDAIPDESTRSDATSGEEGAVNTLAETLLASYESDLWVEGFVLNYQSFLCPNCASTIRVEHWTRQCGLCSYRKYAEYQLQPGQQISSCNDGRRTRVYVYGSYSDRSAYFWNFNFWNCS